MTDTLARYAATFAKVKEKWPDAPGLPEGYRFEQCHGELCVFGPFDAPLPPAAALALCTVTAMEIGAWWVQRAGFRTFQISGGLLGVLSIQVSEHTPGGFVNYAPAEVPDTFALAYLAALEAIVGSST